MLQNPCKTLGFKKNMVYEIPLGGGKPYPASGLSQLDGIVILAHGFVLCIIEVMTFYTLLNYCSKEDLI